MALLVLLTDCLFFSGVRECFAFAEGSACGWGKTKCAIYERTFYCFLVSVNFVCAVAITHVTFIFNGVRECFAFQNILCGGKKIKTQKGRQ
jgi:hypothetical protein